jgi:hypothetical protein
MFTNVQHDPYSMLADTQILCNPKVVSIAGYHDGGSSVDVSSSALPRSSTRSSYDSSSDSRIRQREGA